GNHNDGFFHFFGAHFSGTIGNFLDDFGSSFNWSHNSSNPFIDMPTGSVRVGTVFDDGHTGLSSVRFGGGSGINRSNNHDWDNRNEFSWVTGNGKHRLKVGQEFDYSWSTIYSSGNLFGSYAYQTLSDLAANAPASYSVTLTSYERESKGSSLG